MKGYRFYEELTGKNRKGEQSQGNVIALHLRDDDNQPLYSPDWSMICISAVYFEPNSPVCTCSVSWEYLSEKARRIKESRAREIHPNLFRYLENG